MQNHMSVAPQVPITSTPSPQDSASQNIAPPEDHELIIEARRGWIAIDWSELYRYRELYFFLVWRDLKVRYKQTVLGVAWAVLQPVMYVLIFTTIFGNAAGLKNYLPVHLQDKYPLFVLVGQIPWQIFSVAMSLGGMSLINQQHLLTKIYFPRLFIPAATVGGAVVDMVIAFGIAVVMMAWYQFIPPISIIALPFLILITVMACLGVAYTLSALTVTYRDFRFIVPLMVQVLMYASFVGYPVEIIKGSRYEPLFMLNPMFGIVSGYRSAILGTPWQVTPLVVASVISIVLFVFGLFYFRRTERRFADIA